MIFYPDGISLEIWSEVFAKKRGLSFFGVGSPNIVYRLARGEDSARSAREILTLYDNARREEEKNDKEN